jgi:hypothetical protein
VAEEEVVVEEAEEEEEVVVVVAAEVIFSMTILDFLEDKDKIHVDHGEDDIEMDLETILSCSDALIEETLTGDPAFFKD